MGERLIFRKFTSATILDAQLATSTSGMMKNAHRAVFNYTPREGYLYVRSRAISSRCNDNFDMFPAEEIEKAYMTFIGKPVFVNHHNENHHRARGVIIDAAIHKDINPDGSPDTWVELLHEVDAVRFPKLAKAIIAKEVNRTSMGCDVQFSKCSVCHNVAQSPLEYCTHIPGKKGKRIVTGTGGAGEREATLVFEICSGLSFFENSLLVEQPADPTAFFLGDVEYGAGLERMAAGAPKTASLPNRPASLIPVGEGYYIGNSPEEIQWRKTASKTPTNNSNSTWGLINRAAAEEATVTASVKRRNIWDLIKHADKIGDDIDNPLPTVTSANHPEAHMAGQQHWPAMKPIVGSRPGMKDADVDWFKKNPASSAHIIDHYSQATDEEKEQGKHWYPEIGHGAAVLAHGGNPTLSYDHARHQGSGVVSAFSPQSEFHANMLNAMTTMRHQAAPAAARTKSAPQPHDHEGYQAMESSAVNADKIVKGAHPNEVLGGHKTHAFYHNLAHGGQESDSAPCNCPNTHVTVDAHALSVAVGKRIRPKADGGPDMSDYHTYHHVADMYRDATHVISQKEKRDIHPSEVQAVTWLVRQRLNNDKAQTTKSNNTKTKLHDRLRSNGYDPEEIMGASKSNHTHLEPQKEAALRRYAKSFQTLSYGETKAPQDVDTLRAENCTVCGNSTAFDGVQCQICGYVAPPRPFGDPDTDTARTNDMRKQVLDSDTGLADPNDPDQQLGNETGDPGILEEQADDATEEGTVPPLSCMNCGVGIQPAPPTSTGGEPPYPAEGDVCPVCKKGELAADSGDEADEDMDGDGIPDDAEGNDDANSGAVPPSKGDEDPTETDEDQEPEDDEEDDAPPPKDKKGPKK